MSVDTLKDQSPLVQVGWNYIEEEYASKSMREKKEAYRLIQLLCCSMITTQHAIDQMVAICGNGIPAIKIATILRTSEGTTKRRKQTPNKSRKQNPWQEKENMRLLKAVHLYGLNRWAKVARFVGGGRTSQQCFQKWHRCLNPFLNKGHWTEEEDKKLIELVRKHGDFSWQKVSSEIQTRSDFMCRCRYQILLKKANQEKTVEIKPLYVPEETKNSLVLNSPFLADLEGDELSEWEFKTEIYAEMNMCYK
ncbi:Myb-like DNA-binding domain containing protein [Tritrichomonas foetus]|uniref:Myb-like DNA-binding domain containing protein n=1 Tax=Tritrichomonas foetus TaxID=1144522 RepID=A0A1J4KHS2_9EUKA|nr:Myb-like DNA-binding domain containing protein [Tritrichomonas foetus]|eukprot:OHT10586.1 Myb-like DNA-binding domain containing protein [Tritrichomonas foetus]